MVEKLRYLSSGPLGLFESSVNSYGRKTMVGAIQHEKAFESSVNSYGRKTALAELDR